eukprot:Skav217747  [mRNA]  locus=scaffold7254:24374:25267:+ [translate_table: standard]
MGEQPVLLSGAAQPSRLATLGYWAIALGHLWVLRVHAVATGAEAMLFTTLALVECALAVEAAVYAIGSWGHQFGLPLLTLAGRVRLLGAAMAWPWLLPWASELSCRCGTVTAATGQILRHLTLALAGLLTAFYLWGEVQLLIFTSPTRSSGQDSMMAGCLPETLLGGQFRLDKADLEETGRAVFVPAQPRKALYVGAGLALMGHLTFGLAFGLQALPPWLLLGAIMAMVGRWVGNLPPMKSKGEREMNTSDATVLWRREAPRLACRLGELLWIYCCVLELQRCETSSSWMLACSDSN